MCASRVASRSTRAGSSGGAGDGAAGEAGGSCGATVVTPRKLLLGARHDHPQRVTLDAIVEWRIERHQLAVDGDSGASVRVHSEVVDEKGVDVRGARDLACAAKRAEHREGNE